MNQLETKIKDYYTVNMSTKQEIMKVTVRTPHHESKFEAPPKTSGRELFSNMCKSLGIQEHWYFGLMYRGADDEEIWIDKSKKNLKAFEKVLSNIHFKVKFFPEEVAEELIENITIEYFFLQVKADILKDEIFCPADTCVLLASYALQVKYGDYRKADLNEDFFKKHALLPERVTKQHKMDDTEWKKQIVSMWQKHRALDKEDAMLEYLKLAQNLEMYGVTYFPIKNKKGTDVLLGVTSLGMNIYKTDDKLNPTISFPWSEIRNLRYKGLKFIIKPTDPKAKDFVILTSNEKTSKNILNLGIGNHELYVRRRKPDSPEIAKMKEKANEVRKNKLLIRQNYNSERIAREEAEKRETMYKEQLEEMKREMERKHASLMEAERTIKRLQEQLDDLKRSKDELESQRIELQEMMERLEHSKSMEAAEKIKLEEEIRTKHMEVQKFSEEVQRKDEETRRLQEEVEEARRREEELRIKQEEEARHRAEEAERRHREEEERHQRELEESAKNERELESLPEGANMALPDIVQVNESLKEQLKNLQNQLNETRTNEESELDRIHRVNLLEGRDKYKTLADIRRGNTIRRVEMFENM